MHRRNRFSARAASATLALAALALVSVPAASAVSSGSALLSTGSDETGPATPALSPAAASALQAQALDAARAARAAVDSRSVARPSATAALAQPVDIYYIPHQDDEVLSFGSLIWTSVQQRHRVIVVNYTDGSSTGVCARGSDGLCHANNEYDGTPVSQFVADRTQELVDSVGALGVPSSDVVSDPLIPADGTHPAVRRIQDGAVTLDFTSTVLAYYAALYPGAHHYAMSWVDGNADHRLMGVALRAAVDIGTVPGDRASFSMFRIYWQADYPAPLEPSVIAMRSVARLNYGMPTDGSVESCDGSSQCVKAVNDALDAYRTPFDIGYRSVPTFLDTLAADPAKQVVVHGPDAIPYVLRTSIDTVTPVVGPIRVDGRCTPLKVGAVPTTLGDGHGLAANLDPAAAVAVAGWGGPVRVTATNWAGVPLATTSPAPVTGGAWRTTLSIPLWGSVLRTECQSSTWIATNQASTPIASMSATIAVGTGSPTTARTVSGALGQLLTVRATVALGGRPVSGLHLVLRQPGTGGEAGSSAVTDAYGRATFTGRVGRSSVWQLVPTSVIRGASVPAQIVFTAKAVPGRAWGRFLATSYPRVSGYVAVRGYLRSVPTVPAKYLAGHTIRLVLVRPGRTPITVGQVTVAADATFAARVYVRYAGVLRADLVGKDPYLPARNGIAATTIR